MGRLEIVNKLAEASRLIEGRHFREADLVLVAVSEQLKKKSG